MAEISLATLNLHCGLDRSAQPYPVKAAVAALDTDVIVVQENWRPRGRESIAAEAARSCGYSSFAELDLIADAPLAALDIVAGQVPDEAGAWGLAVLSRLPWSGSHVITLGAAPGDVAGPRRAQVVSFSLGAAVTLRVVNTHLTHRVLHGPRQLRRLVRELDTTTQPTVIAGDLNMFRPTVYLARPYRPVVRGATWPADRPIGQLDHVLAGPGVTTCEAQVLDSVGSDHRPVRIVLGVAGVR